MNEQYKLQNGQPNYLLREIRGYHSDDLLKAEANELVINEEIEGYFYIPSDFYATGQLEYRAKNIANIKIQERFLRTFEKIILEHQLEELGLDISIYNKLKTKVSFNTLKVIKEGKEEESSFHETFILAYVGILMIIFMVLTSGQLLVRSLLEEKSNKVMEVLLSSCSAQDLMIGKIVGLSGLGILQMFIYGAFGVGISLKTNVATFQIDFLFLILLYAILGYIFYAAILVTAGSPVTTEQEAQQVNTYVGLLLVIPISFLMVIMQNPNSPIIQVLSYIPLFTPPVMVMRIAIQTPPLWEIILTILLLIASTMVMMWIAGKIFRMAILSYGKRPTVKEMFMWLRQTD